MTTGAKRFTDLRAWQACDVLKKAIYDLCDGTGAISRDFSRRKQIEESSSRTTAHIAEGFGRFFPAHFVDKKYISETRRLELNQLAESALEEVTGLIQSPEALRNARRARERHIAARPERRQKAVELRTRNKKNAEPNENTNNEQ